MITIDSLDDEVVQKNKPERSRKSPERRSPNQQSGAGMAGAGKAHAYTAGADPAGAEEKQQTKSKSRLAELAQRALNTLRGATGEEEG